LKYAFLRKKWQVNRPTSPRLAVLRAGTFCNMPASALQFAQRAKRKDKLYEKNFSSTCDCAVGHFIGLASRKTNPAPSRFAAENKIVSSTPAGEQLVPEVSITLPDNTLPPTTDSTTSSVGQTSSTISLEDNGKTFNFNVGDVFLLNLGADVYDWTVTIDNQDVAALSAGTATLTAVGEPVCLKASPPCMVPTILFKVTLIVQ
jgi:hypothetical protein